MLTERFMESSYPEFLKPLHSGGGAGNSDFDEGVRRYLDFAYRYLTVRPLPIFRSVPGYDPEDFKMDTIVEFLRNDARALRSYRDRGTPFIVWYRKSAKHRAIDVMRRWITRHGIEVPLDRPEAESGESGPIDPPARPEPELDPYLRKILGTAMESLKDPVCRAVVALLSQDGYTNREIGSRLRIGRERIGGRVRNCLDSMKRILRKMGFSAKKLGLD